MRTADCLTCEGTDSCCECEGSGRCHAEEHDVFGSDCHCGGFGECPACDGTGTCQECEGLHAEKALNADPSLEEAFDKLMETLGLGARRNADDKGSQEAGPLQHLR